MRARALGADVALVVHLYGNPAPTRHVRDVFPAPECLLVDDAAQALGSRGPDGLAGAMGDVGLLSFGHSKHITCGNATVLFRSAGFAKEVAAMLGTLELATEQNRNALSSAFRIRLEAARAHLRLAGDSAAGQFSGLLEGMEPVLDAPLVVGAEAPLLHALTAYPEEINARVEKAAIWSSALTGTGLQPVGMGPGCVPWRYACRLPGISWRTQHDLAEGMRADGVHVSNWYLPAHWYLGCGVGTLPGAETLAREVFQFWVDNETSRESIERDATRVQQHLARRSLLETQDA
jgi:dTDP-4-amino-4,6-dideoxygalactose transaminase